MWFGIYFNVLFTLCMLKTVVGKPFLYDGPSALTTLASSASASASSPSQPLTNIADLRRKQQKAELLQQEKQLANEENDNADAFIEGEENETNEAAPSILQKKINKILTKIRIISSLSSAVSGGGDGNGETTNTAGDDKDDDFRRELEEFDREFENDVLNKKDEKNNTDNAPTFQKVIYPYSDSAEPVKVSFDINPRIVNRKQSQIVDEIDVEDEIDEMAETMGRLGQIGVFFAELLGSVVGLVYGAAAQINNVAQGTTTTSII